MAGRRQDRQEGTSSIGQGSQADGDSAAINRELLQQYAAGKKFKVKYLGSHDIEDYRNKRETSAVMSELKKRSGKAPKPKAIITLYAKEVVVMDEKSKTVTMKVPVQKIKFVCHDKHDKTLFGVILATDRVTSDSQRLHRLFCYHAEQKVALSFVRTINELFQILGSVMRERRRRAEETNGSSASGSGARGVARPAVGGASSSGGRDSAGGRQTNQSQAASSDVQKKTTNEGDPQSDEEKYEPVPLGFGIEAPPPSYKAAISKKNESIFKKPDDIETTVTTRLAPPPGGSVRTKKLAAPLPTPRRNTQPSAVLPPVSGRNNAPPITPPTASSNASQIARPRHPPTTQSVSQVSAIAPPIAPPTARPRHTPTIPSGVQAPVITSATSLPLPQLPDGVDGGRGGVATFSIGSGESEGENGFDPNSDENNIYDVPSNNTVAPPNQVPSNNVVPPTNQVQRAAVWQEWQALESELQSIAQDLGFDMDNGTTSIGGPAALPPLQEDFSITSPSFPGGANVDVNQSFTSTTSDDPFTDDFFQTSFGSSTVSVSMQAAWPESVSSAVVELGDPFGGGASSDFGASWGSAMTDPVNGASGGADPFQEGAISSGSGQAAATNGDPFEDNTPTPTSAAVSFDFTGFSTQTSWGESNTATATEPSSQAAAPATQSFQDVGFGTDWSAFGVSAATSSSSSTVPQPLTKQATQPAPTVAPLPTTTTPSRQPKDSAILIPPAVTENTFESDWGSSVTSAVTTTPSSSISALPPPVAKRDSVGILPPPISTSRRADSISDHSQPSSSSSSRSRPRPSIDNAPDVAAGQVVLNRPAKSKSSPSSGRASSMEIDVQQPDFNVPASDFSFGTEVTNASFEISGTSSQGTANTLATTATAASDPFQSSLPSQSASQATVQDPFLEDLPKAVVPPISEINDTFPSLQATGPTSQAIASDAFSVDQLPANLPVNEASIGNPFLDDFPQLDSIPSSNAPVSDSFQDVFASPAALPTIKASTDNQFLDSHLTATKPNGLPPTSAENQMGVATKPEVGVGAWSAFDDAGIKPREKSNSDWFAAIGSTDINKEGSSTKQEPAAWSAFDSQPQEQAPSTSTFSGFGDDWIGLSDNRGSDTSPTGLSQQAATSHTVKSTTPATAISTSSEKKTEPSWSAFGQDAATTPTSSRQSQPQQKSTQSPVSGLISPPSKPNRSSASGLKLSRSRPPGRQSTDRLAEKSGVVSLNQPASAFQVSQGNISQTSTSSTSSAPQPRVETASNQQRESNTSMNKSSSYLDDLSSLSVQPQFPPTAMNYQSASFPQQPANQWGGPSQGAPQPPFSGQTQLSLKFPYGSQGDAQAMTIQQQQFMQQQQAMFMQQQQAMQQGGGPMQQGPGQFPQGPGPNQMQQGAGAFVQGPGPNQIQQGAGVFVGQGPGPFQQMQPGQAQMQQGPMGVQFSPGGAQMMATGQMQPPHFSTPHQQQNFYQHQQQFQQNPNAFSPIGQPQQQNPFSPGNASMGDRSQLSVTGGSNLSTSNLYTSDFNSPPYAVGSSTPQSGSASPPPQQPVEYRPSVNDGRPDPFAALVSNDLTPTKGRAEVAEKLKAAFMKQPSPSRGFHASPYGTVPSTMDTQGGWS